MDPTRSALIQEARNPDYAGSLQHLRSWSQIDSLLQKLAGELEEAEREIFVLKTLCESKDRTQKSRTTLSDSGPNTEIVSYADPRDPDTIHVEIGRVPSVTPKPGGPSL